MPEEVVPPIVGDRAPVLKGQPHSGEAMIADLERRRAEEAAIAKVQDAALEAVRIACEKERNSVSNPKVETK